MLDRRFLGLALLAASLVVSGAARAAWSAAGDTIPFATAVLALPGGRVCGLSDGVPRLFDPAKSAWTTGAPGEDRPWAEAVALGDGRVLVFEGGKDPFAAIYDPVADSWKPTEAPSAVETRKAVLLADGRLLAAGGGVDVSAAETSGVSSAEIYDPASGRWSPAASLGEARMLGALIALPSGGALYLGGARSVSSTPGGIVRTDIASIERYDQATDRWTFVGELPAPSAFPTAVSLAKGGVLVTGDGFAIELDPTKDTSRSLAEPPLAAHDLARLADGRVFASTELRRMQIYDPVRDAWTTLGGPGDGSSFRVVALPDASILAVSNGQPPQRFRFEADGVRCTGAGACGSGHCADGVCCATACTESCSRCDVAGSLGRCVAVSGPLNHCGAGKTCTAGACTDLAGTTCSADLASARAADGRELACAPFLCDRQTGACRDRCVASDDCSPGSVCETDRSTCTTVGPSPDEGGCAASTTGVRRGAWTTVFVLLLGWLVRRAPRRRRS